MSRRASSRRQFLTVLGAGAAYGWASGPGFSWESPPADSPDDLLYLSATRLSELLRDKKVSALELVQAHLTRIEAVNGRLNAVVTLAAERALREARAADESLARGKLLGPLHGVPMTIKDSFETQGVVSTGGTLGRKGYIPGRDATVVARLRQAGGILLGKTNTPELTLRATTDNLIYGPTRNPYQLEYEPAGSSGGAAAIIATGGAPFDIGTDYGGSIRLPAHACGVAGLKPTAGRVPRTGHIIDYGGPFDSFQQVGPLARRVEDLILLLRIISGPDSVDAAIAPMPLGDPAAVDLRSLKVAFYLTNGVVEPTPEIQRTVQQCATFLTEAGCRVTEDRPPLLKEAFEIRERLVGADGRAHVRRLLQKYGTTVVSPGVRLEGEVLTPAQFTDLLEQLDSCRSQMLAWFERFDLFVCPVSPYPARPLAAEPLPIPVAASYTSVFNITGWPAGVVRAGTSPEGLPLGVQVVGRPWTEEKVVATLQLLESRTGGWQKPPL
jgi:amidase